MQAQRAGGAYPDASQRATGILPRGGAGATRIERAGSYVLIRRRTVADDEGMPPLLRTTLDRHAVPTAGFRFALAKRASGEGRPARAVLVQSASAAAADDTTAFSRRSSAGRVMLQSAKDTFTDDF